MACPRPVFPRNAVQPWYPWTDSEAAATVGQAQPFGGTEESQGRAEARRRRWAIPPSAHLSTASAGRARPYRGARSPICAGQVPPGRHDPRCARDEPPGRRHPPVGRAEARRRRWAIPPSAHLSTASAGRARPYRGARSPICAGQVPPGRHDPRCARQHTRAGLGPPTPLWGPAVITPGPQCRPGGSRRQTKFTCAPGQENPARGSGARRSCRASWRRSSRRVWIRASALAWRRRRLSGSASSRSSLTPALRSVWKRW